MKKARRPWWNNKYSISQLFLQARHPHRTKATYGAEELHFLNCSIKNPTSLYYKNDNQNTERWHSFFLSLLFENTLGEVRYMWRQIEVLRGDWWNTTVWTFQEAKCAVGSHQGWSRIHFNSISSGSNAYKCQIQRTRSISICFFKRTSRTELALVMSRSEMEQTPAQVPMLRVNWCEGEHCYSSWSLNHDLVS